MQSLRSMRIVCKRSSTPSRQLPRRRLRRGWWFWVGASSCRNGWFTFSSCWMHSFNFRNCRRTASIHGHTGRGRGNLVRNGSRAHVTFLLFSGTHHCIGTYTHTPTRLTVLYQGLPGEPVPERYKKLSYHRGTARCVVSIEILPSATQQSRNYLYDKS